MLTILAQAYPWLLALHILSFVAWMAGLLYLPRLFVYHSAALSGSDASETFKVMERRLLRGIMNPAMIATWVFGVLLAFAIGAWADLWLWAKLACVAGLSAMHMAMARWRREFAADRNRRPQRFYRIANEVPTVLLIVIVFLVIFKPF